MSEKQIKGPFYIEEVMDKHLLPEGGIERTGLYAVLASEPSGGTFILFFRLRKEKAIEFCNRLNSSVQFWLRKQDRDMIIIDGYRLQIAADPTLIVTEQEGGSLLSDIWIGNVQIRNVRIGK